MGADLDFRILGPLEVVGTGAPLPLGHGQQRLLLAILLLSANEVVPADRIVEELWPSGRPGAAATALHGHVSALRKVLGRDRIVTRPPGYLVRVEDDELDLTRFERLLAAARAAPDASSRADILSQALALWRGEPLGDVPREGAVHVEVRRLEELRLVALEDRIDADLALGRRPELVPELERLVSQHPLRERPRAQLMLALYRSGRQAEALQAYRDMRQLLVEEIGIEPGLALKTLERRILSQDPELARDLEAPEIAVPSPLPASPRRAGRRKRVTVLFAAAAEARRDPESAGRLAARYFEAARPVLEHHEARVERVMGESLLAVFGIPRLHDDDAVRAVRAAAELRGVLSAAAARIGIATGEVFVDDSAADGVFVTGEPVRLAARLQAAAAPGEILLADETRRVVHHAVVVEPVEPEQSGSKAPVWKLRDVLPGAPGVARHLDAPLVGRERELADLERALDRVLAEGTSHLFTLLGQAGIGKSRLAGEFTARAAPRAQIVIGRCQPYGEGITYWPLAEIVRQLAGETPREGLARFLADDLDAETVVDRILGAVGEGSARPTSDEISWAASRLIETVAQARPLVVVFEDLHWAEPTFLDLIEHCADWLRDAPVLLLCLARLELLDERRSWPGGKLNATTILLETLAREDSSRLLANADEADELDVPARERIVEVAGGNPLFLEQMAAAARAEPRGGAFVRPTTIDALLAARLERLADGERAVIECAAVQGAEFWRDAVEELLPPHVRVQAGGWFGALVAKDLIRPRRSPVSSRDAFRFRHELIRQAAYDGSAKATRAELHERLGDWLEASESGPEELVGYHFEQASRYGRELGLDEGRVNRLAQRGGERLGRGGMDAFDRGDVPAAINLLERAIDLLPTAVEGQATFAYTLGAALVEAGHLVRGEDVLAEARDAARATGDRQTEARATVELAFATLMTTGDDSAMLAAAHEASAVGNALGDDHVLAKALHRLGLSHFGVEQYAQGVETFERARLHARVARDTREEADILYFLGASTYFGPAPVLDEIPKWERFVAESRDSLALEAASLHTLGSLYGLRKRFDEGRAAISRALELYAQAGMIAHRAGTTYTLGELELNAADPAAAERAVRPGYDTFMEMGERSFLGGGAAFLGRATYEQGRYDDAQEFINVLGAVDDHQSQIERRALQSKLLARRGSSDEAVALGQEAVALSRRGDSPILQARMLTDLGEVLSLAGHPREAAESLEQAISLHERKENLAGVERVRGLLADLAARSA